MSSLPPTSLASTLLQAARVDAAVFAGRSLADGLLAQIEPRARPAVQDLVYGSLRAYGRGDFVLARLLSRPLAQDEVRALLLVTRVPDLVKRCDQTIQLGECHLGPARPLTTP